MRSAAATRVLALFRFLCFSGLSPLFGTRGASVAWKTNCFSVGKRLQSGPYSLSTTSTVSTPMASICVTSTPAHPVQSLAHRLLPPRFGFLQVLHRRHRSPRMLFSLQGGQLR